MPKRARAAAAKGEALDAAYKAASKRTAYQTSPAPPPHHNNVQMWSCDEQSYAGNGPPPSTSAAPDTTDRKKAIHLKCEKQRREAINSGYQELRELLPSSFTNLGCKTTNASILFRAAEHLRRLQEARAAQVDELRRLKAELSAVSIIADQYEHISKTGAGSPDPTDDDDDAGDATGGAAATPQSLKLRAFTAVMEAAFGSFEPQVDMTDYASLARTLLVWIEGVDWPNMFSRQS